MPRSDALDRINDGETLLRLRRAVRLATAELRQHAELIAGADPSHVGRLGLLPGSFNPPTRAHLALAIAALAAGEADAALLTLSTHTVEKERIVGAMLEDRLLLLDLLRRAEPRLGVLLVNRGLYVEQAELARSRFSGVSRVVFLVGFDKIVQIFDPRYYDERDAQLDRLFGLAEIIVAPRGESGSAELRALLARPENARFRQAVRPLELLDDLRGVASSQVRAATAAGTAVGDDVPEAVRLFVEETGAYGASSEDRSRYAARIAALDAAEREGIPSGRRPGCGAAEV